MRIKETCRGFELIEFTDDYGESCSLQESSSVSPHVWLGCNNNTQAHHVTEEPVSPRMHLNPKQVAALVKHLTQWLLTGSFK